MPAASAACRMAASVGWSGSSPSGRLLTSVVKPSAAAARTSSGVSCVGDGEGGGEGADHGFSLSSPSSLGENLVRLPQHRQERLPIALQLGIADARHPRQLGERARTFGDHRAQDGVVEHDIGRDAPLRSPAACAPP